jgi:hypothetical protein
MSRDRGIWLVGLSSLLAAACSSSNATQPPLAPCTAASGGRIALQATEYTAIDPAQTAGCAVFPANTTPSIIEYLLVPQGASGVPDDSASFQLRGAGLAAAPPLAAGAAGATSVPVQLQFDRNLRRAERQLAAQFGHWLRPSAVAPARAAAPPVGDTRPFKVCGTLDCNTHPTVTATAKKVSAHVAIYVDSAALKSGDTLGTADLDALAAVFDTLLYPADTQAFGPETDVDHNGVVLVLMTGKVNSLVANPCTTGFVAGYFYGGDLLPPASFPNGNYAEIFYSIVPDPNGTLSCPHTATGVNHSVPGTFIHEFQHMISWGRHVVNGNGFPEELWLNEGLSHYAEELGSRLYVPADSTTFCYFIAGNLYNSGQYFTKPDSSFLVDTAGIGGLANRGAYWLFVRYVVDQFSADTSIPSNDAFTRTLEDPMRTGASNLAHATATSFSTLLGRWALANYVSDLPGFTAPSQLQYAKWRFRSDYPTIANRCAVNANFTGIPGAYPLTPNSSVGSALNLSGMLRSGSGPYTIAQQPAGATGFTLLFSTGTGTALRTSLVPRLNVLRLQ